jgi:mannosyltransferase
MHCVDTGRFSPGAAADRDLRNHGLPGRYGVGCFGRVRHQKGTDLFVDAMIGLLPRYSEWTAFITGRVTAEQQGFADALKQRVKEAGLEDRILFLGEVDAILPWYRRISLYVAPSRNEGFGLTPLEAMATGVVAVASDAGAYGEMIENGTTGAVVRAGDGAALRAAIESYLADPNLAERHGAAALAHVRAHFALEREAAGIGEVYESLWPESARP